MQKGPLHTSPSQTGIESMITNLNTDLVSTTKTYMSQEYVCVPNPRRGSSGAKAQHVAFHRAISLATIPTTRRSPSRDKAVPKPLAAEHAAELKYSFHFIKRPHWCRSSAKHVLPAYKGIAEAAPRAANVIVMAPNVPASGGTPACTASVARSSQPAEVGCSVASVAMQSACARAVAHCCGVQPQSS